MPRHRHDLPQLRPTPFLTDGGLETTLLFHDGLELPDFAAFTLLASPEQREALKRYFLSYIDLAQAHGIGLVLETPTWRANPDWGWRLGYTLDALAQANRQAVQLLAGLRPHLAPPENPMVVSGCIGPRGDGYVADRAMSAQQARAYHHWQIGVLARTDVDMLCAMTMTTAEEATGVVLAARDEDMPVAISFTVETDGALPSGQALGAAIEQIDQATGGHAAYFMINCAHPAHFEHTLTPGSPWLDRLRGIRANASQMSHAELDAASELDDGDPVALGQAYALLHERLPRFNVMGGCCGTDLRHVDQMARHCKPLFSRWIDA